MKLWLRHDRANLFFFYPGSRLQTWMFRCKFSSFSLNHDRVFKTSFFSFSGRFIFSFFTAPLHKNNFSISRQAGEFWIILNLFWRRYGNFSAIFYFIFFKATRVLCVYHSTVDPTTGLWTLARLQNYFFLFFSFIVFEEVSRRLAAKFFVAAVTLSFNPPLHLTSNFSIISVGFFLFSPRHTRLPFHV